MSGKRILIYSACSLALFAGGVAVGQDINPKVHPHLFEAQRLIASADGQIDAAQAAWHDKLAATLSAQRTCCTRRPVN